MAKLIYIGPKLSTGEPERSLIFDGIPAGDVKEDELTSEQVELALRSGLYAREGHVRETKDKLAGKAPAAKKTPAPKKAADPTPPRTPRIVTPKPPAAIAPAEPTVEPSDDVTPAAGEQGD